jgi:NAD(P)H-hydrate epimerase
MAAMKLDTVLLSVRQMSEADRLTVASGTPASELMDNAGRAVASEIQKRWTVRPVLVLCGPGNNGGDGFVVARQLAQAGWPVRIALLGAREHLSGVELHHAALWLGCLEPLMPAALDGAELVVDALFGAGLDRALEGSAKETLAVAARLGLPIVAIDTPSGLMGDTGEILGGSM